jgi:hypothetical protein
LFLVREAGTESFSALGHFGVFVECRHHPILAATAPLAPLAPTAKEPRTPPTV